MDKANAKKRALSLPLPGMNRTPSAQSSDSTTNTTLAIREERSDDDDDDDVPFQGNPGKKRAAPAARRNQPPRAKKSRQIQVDSDDEDDDTKKKKKGEGDEDYQEDDDEHEPSEDEDEDEDEASDGEASPSRVRAQVRAPAKSRQAGAEAIKKEQAMRDAMNRNEPVEKTFLINCKELAAQLNEAGVPIVVAKEFGPITTAAWCIDEAMQLPQLQQECKDREEWICPKKVAEGKPRDKCKRKGHAPPRKLRAQIFLCWWHHTRLAQFGNGTNFPCAKPLTDQQRAFGQRRRDVSKLAREAQKASASSSNTTLALPANSDDEDGGGAHALTVAKRGRPESEGLMLHKAATQRMELMSEVQTLKGQLASVRDELAGEKALGVTRNAQIEGFRKEADQYKAELKQRGNTALVQNMLRQEQQQGAETTMRSFEAAVHEVCGADTLAQVKALVANADEEREGAAHAPWEKVARDVKSMQDATQVAWEAGPKALRAIAAAEQADGGVPKKAKEKVADFKEELVEHQKAFESIRHRTNRLVNRIGEVKLTIDKAAKKAAKKAANAALEAAQDSQDEMDAMETAAFEAQGQVQGPEPLEA